MIIILEMNESKEAKFSGYEFYFKKNIHRTFLYLSKYPFNTLTADNVYSGSNRKNLRLTVQMQLPKFCCKFIAFLESKLNFEHFKTKMSIIA